MRFARILPAALLGAAACAPAGPPASGVNPRLHIVDPPAGRALTENFPPPREPTEPVRRAVFDAINRDRAAEGRASVAWDEGAARVAESFCAAQISEKTRGHFLRDGVPPYARTGLAGVFGYQAENSAAWSTTSPTFPDTPMDLALGAHRSMLAETPPEDGHRLTMLDPLATHVGVGWAMAGGRFQIAQEFLARGLDRLTLATDPSAKALRVSGAARSPLRLDFVTIAREPLPARLTREEANARTSYKYPAAAEAYVAEGRVQMRVSGMVTLDKIHLGRDRDFSFTFAPTEPGLFTIVFWVSRKGDDRPRPGGSAVVRAEA
ncbi:MAG TPA: CAP domain-containing protein [Thermoanaerobaculia bacterium]|nr:CAP domain-containing protein [Thermoanaerobaculia bacterium]